MVKIENAFEPIIEREVFEEVQKKTERNKKVSAEYKAKEVYLLSGLLFCGKCGARYTGQTNRKNKNGKEYISSYYGCSNRNKIGKCTNDRVKRYLIEDEVVKALYEKILNGNSIETLLDKIQVEYNKALKENNEYLNDLRQELKEVNKQIDNLILLAEQNPLKSILVKLEILESHKEDIEYRLEHLDISVGNRITAKKVSNLLEKDIKNLQKGSKIELKKLINKYIKKITVNDNETITIDYVFTEVEDILNTQGCGPSLPIIFKITLSIKKRRN